MFIEEMKDLLKQEKKLTENGAVGYETSGSALVDLNFATSSLRFASDEEIVQTFVRAFSESPDLAVKWIFFARDVRGGMGERRLFRVLASALSRSYPDEFCELLQYIPEYGRWDDLIYLLDYGLENSLQNEIYDIITRQLTEDMANDIAGKPISLLAKWLPSENASSSKTKERAKEIINRLEIKPRDYRKMLSRLRKSLDVVEVKMCDNKWDEIGFNTVPSNANLKYKNAFMRHEPERYQLYIDKVNSGAVKMNVSNLYPHEILSKYKKGSCFDESLEAMWKSLPRSTELKRTIVVSDGSGSMFWASRSPSPIDVAESLAIYFSETCVGEFRDKYITFSNRPQLVDFGKVNSLYEKMNIIASHDEVSNTNIEAVFDLILNTALRGNMSQDEIPEVVLIISDMEFDSATASNWWDDDAVNKPSKALFEAISDNYRANGYKLPKLVFWNVASRTNVVPIQENDSGVALLSGFSPTIFDMVMSGKLSPYDILVEKLMSDRYKDIKFEINE